MATGPFQKVGQTVYDRSMSPSLFCQGNELPLGQGAIRGKRNCGDPSQFAPLCHSRHAHRRPAKNPFKSASASRSPTPATTSGAWWHWGWAKTRAPPSTPPDFGSDAP